MGVVIAWMSLGRHDGCKWKTQQAQQRQHSYIQHNNDNHSNNKYQHVQAGVELDRMTWVHWRTERRRRQTAISRAAHNRNNNTEHINDNVPNINNSNRKKTPGNFLTQTALTPQKNKRENNYNMQLERVQQDNSNSRQLVCARMTIIASTGRLVRTSHPDYNYHTRISCRFWWMVPKLYKNNGVELRVAWLRISGRLL